MHVRGKSSQTKIMKRVSFSLTSVQGSVSEPVRMEALTTEKICTTLEPVEISLEKYPHPRACAAIAKEPVIDPCRYERLLTLVRVAAHAFRGVLYFQVKKKFRFQRNVSREVTRRQVILVPTDTMGGVPSRVWKAERKPSFIKHQCYLGVGSLLCERDRLLQVGGRLQCSDLPEGTKHPIILPHAHPVV